MNETGEVQVPMPTDFMKSNALGVQPSTNSPRRAADVITTTAGCVSLRSAVMA